MSGATSSYPVARFILPEYVSRGNDNKLSCPVYQDGALVAPDSATFFIFDGAGKTIFTGSAAISGSIASITSFGRLWLRWTPGRGSGRKRTTK